jgi:hypothetical protein
MFTLVEISGTYSSFLPYFIRTHRANYDAAQMDAYDKDYLLL